MVRLSTPIANLREHYTVVVVGSGYGGGIAASRLARAGQQVCVLERGKELQPGEYPNTGMEALREMQMHLPDGDHEGSRTGLFDFHINHDIHALVGCGLGGTSLINANVSLRAEPRVFDDPRWPHELRDDHAALDEGYRRAEEMLKPTPYPQDAPPLLKLQSLEKSAAAMNAKCYRPPINVNFKDGVNHVGVEQRACQLCGDCVSGCNYGAKNTTLMNYLPDARNHGAEIFTQVSVRHLERRDSRWVVHYQIVDSGREAFNAPTLFVTADLVVLAAGTLGSTEILLRSRVKGLPLSDQLGLHFTGNGDVLGFAYNTDQAIDSLGYGSLPPQGREPVGPCITGVIDLREQPQLDDGMVIEEGAIPGALGYRLLADTFAAAAVLIGNGGGGGIGNELEQAAREADSLVRGPYHGSVKNSQVYLVMTHDDGAGRLVLENEHLRIEWPGVGDQPIFAKVNERLAQATAALKGVYLKDPIWSKAVGDELITVHPLGGCAMADAAERGVVNHKGQVFSANTGAAVYEGLYVCDGAIVPLPIGVNPLLTISGLAERACALMARDRGWTIDYDLPSAPSGPPAPQKVGIRFTETMKGFFSTKVTNATALDDYQRAYELGQQDGSSFQFILTIQSDDLETMLSDPNHEARMVGTVTAPTLSAEPLDATEGVFNLFVVNPEFVDTKNMRYRMRLDSEEGKSFYFTGFKVIKDDPLVDMWPQTTTLYVTVREGPTAGSPVLGQGVLHIDPEDFVRQLTTMEAVNATSAEERLQAVAKFGACFAGVLFETYGGVFATPTHFHPEAPPRKRRPLRTTAPEVHFFNTQDNVRLCLTRYRGGTKGPLLLSPGMGASYFLFQVDTIDTNLLEFLFAHGYDVWLLDYRASIALPSAAHDSNADEVAKYDYPAAVAKVRAVTGAEAVDLIVHCYGSITLFMSMLAGLDGVRSIVASQVATDLVAPPLTELKAGLHVPELLEALGVKSLTPQDSGGSTSMAKAFDMLFDRALSLNALAVAQGRCNSATCHRLTFMYGSDFQHEQLNEATHEILHEIFGVSNMRVFEHCALMTRCGHVVNFEGADVYLPQLERLRLPITFIHGAQNEVFVPEATARTYNLLCERFGSELYARHVVAGYGHSDCLLGRNAVRDIFPLILDHLENIDARRQASRERAARPSAEPPHTQYAGGEMKIPMYTLAGVPAADVSTHYVETSDGLGLSLLRFNRGSCDDVVLFIHGLTSSTDMYIMPEHYNVVRYLLDHGFTDVWCLDNRMSNRFLYDLEPHDYSADDVALYDYPPALAKMREQIGNRRIHVICHCMGSFSFMMSLFGKVVDGITSVIANSVALTPRVPTWSRLKLQFAPIAIKLMGFPYVSPRWSLDPGFTWGKVVSKAVSLFHPECDVPACHMLSFMWGAGRPALFLHENLHEVTHQRLGDLFCGTGTNYYKHVLKAVKAGRVVKYDPNDPQYGALPNDYFEYASAIHTPCLFVTGDTNRVFTDSNIVCYNELEKIAPGRHALHVFPHYGHQDVFQGKNSHVDVFPVLLDWLQKHRGEI